MVKLVRISEFAQQLFADQTKAQQASEILWGVLETSSPRLSDIAAKMSGNLGAYYKRSQSFLQENEPHEILKLLFNEEAVFWGDPTQVVNPALLIFA